MTRHINHHQSTPKRALLLGAGYVARHWVPVLQELGYSVSVTTRDGTTDMAGVTCWPFNGGTPSHALREAFEAADIIMTSVPPGRKSRRDPILPALKDLSPRASWIGYLSATSVYGDRDGQWAFEGEPPTPTLARGHARAEAEIDWIETGWPVHIFRLAGIYGLGRAPFDKLRDGSARAVVKAGHVVNRIHIDDILSALTASIAAPDPQAIYNLADGNPAPPQDVLDFAAQLIGVSSPPQVGIDSHEISEMARSFYAETKRIDAQKAKNTLGWTPAHRDYRYGLFATLKAEDKDPKRIYVYGQLNVPAADVDSVRAALPDHIAQTKVETGNITFHVEHDKAQPNLFHVFEIFENQAAVDTHQKRAAATDWPRISARAQRQYKIL